MERILAINPGATSTKCAVFDGEQLVFKKTIEHSPDELKHYPTVFDQYEYRLKLVHDTLEEAKVPLDSLNAVVGRGGLLKPLKGGTYSVNELMVEDMKKAAQGEHASNLGPVLAYNFGRELAIPAFIVDPVSVDEMEAVARISGSPELPRVSMCHTLNTKAVARKVAKDLGKRYEDLNLVVTHLGTGISVSPHRKGQMIDVNNAKEEGPFSPDRSGGLPTMALVKLCYSGKYTEKELVGKLMSKGGVYAYLGTTDLRAVEKMAAEGNQQAEIILQAMAYQIAKEIGAMATTLAGEVDYIILTGGMAHSQRLVEEITRRVKFIAPVTVVPGEEEMEALAGGALRVLRNEEKAQEYK